MKKRHDHILGKRQPLPVFSTIFAAESIFPLHKLSSLYNERHFRKRKKKRKQQQQQQQQPRQNKPNTPITIGPIGRYPCPYSGLALMSNTLVFTYMRIVAPTDPVPLRRNTTLEPSDIRIRIPCLEDTDPSTGSRYSNSSAFAMENPERRACARRGRVGHQYRSQVLVIYLVSAQCVGSTDSSR